MKKKLNKKEMGKILVKARLNRIKRDESYREKALKIFPWICAQCGRTFEGKRLKELTVHHKDHNHNNNPSNGENWELLCVYCHENEHYRVGVADSYITSESCRIDDSDNFSFKHKPFSQLEKIFKK